MIALVGMVIFLVHIVGLLARPKGAIETTKGLVGAVLLLIAVVQVQKLSDWLFGH